MQVGSLVELVDDDWENVYNINLPVKNSVYVVRGISPHWMYPDRTGLLLEEIHNMKSPSGKEYNLQKMRFRELQPPMSVREMVENCQQLCKCGTQL